MSEGGQGTVELRLLEALQQTPGLTMVEFARVVGCCKSVTGDRLRQLARDRKVERDPGGHWRWGEELHVDAEPPTERERSTPALGVKPFWIRSVNDYVRTVTSEFQCVRYG
jgi:hypothetical protein